MDGITVRPTNTVLEKNLPNRASLLQVYELGGGKVVVYRTAFSTSSDEEMSVSLLMYEPNMLSRRPEMFESQLKESLEAWTGKLEDEPQPISWRLSHLRIVLSAPSILHMQITIATPQGSKFRMKPAVFCELMSLLVDRILRPAVLPS